ncbi:MAG TPA: 2-phospho-L-lactate transferase CofD family protein, partial [Candidatus Binatia bacterium]|nr:2-phospho-L-lactate transferase CofD family protein [Candidatus Binatia bacterium]
PSNPITSIGPILAVPGIRSALTASSAPKVGVSPLIGASAISGPAHKLMKACGREASALGVALGYEDFLDTLLIAAEDKNMMEPITKLRLHAVATDIRMTSSSDKRRLARQVLALAGK